MRKKIIIALGFAFSANLGFAQKDLVKFGAVSRGVLQESKLEESDTTNPNRLSAGQTVVDLRVNINPNRKTEIGTVIRMQTEVGGFYRAGDLLQLRQLYVKGLLYDAIGYELGDIYLEMSPYTLYNSDGEVNSNESKIFGQLRQDLSEYDNFNIGNSWWSQGGHVDFGLEFDTTNQTGAHFDVFTSSIVAPSTRRFLSGGRGSLFRKKKYNVTANVVHIFDAKAVNPAEESIKNTVASLGWQYRFDLGNDRLNFDGEIGFSQYDVNAPEEFEEETYLTPDRKEGQFITAKLNYITLDDKLKIGARFLRNGSEFLSAGAQSKRLDFTASPDLFKNVANDPFNNRTLNVFDVISNQNLYNPEISATLMQYDPLYGNALPYGMATPNRQGVIFTVGFADSAKIIDAQLDAALLGDVVGVGTEDKRSFTKINGELSLDVAQLISFKRELSLTGGVQYEQTTRSGDIAKIDLSTTSIDAGLDVEVLTKLHLLAGIKTVKGNGNEFLYDLSNNNEYTLPSFYSVDVDQLLTGVGVRYAFTDDMYLSIKNYSLNVNDNQVSDLDYSFNQWMLFFSLKL